MDYQLSHVDSEGAARMVDVGEKPVTRRTATVGTSCVMKLETAQAIRDNVSAKGDVLQVARLAAIGAAKRTDELIPLCHSLPLDSIDVQFEWISDTVLRIRVTAEATAKTGVEMEALVGASIAAATVYDMCKAMDRTMQIEATCLERKSGGASGDYSRVN